MIRLPSITPFKLMLPVLGALLFGANLSHAVPIVGTVETDGSSYTVIHNGATPGGSGNRDDWWWFDTDQPLYVELFGTDVSLFTPLDFSLSTNNGATGNMTITALNLDLNDLTDGFAGGSMDYVLNDSIVGTFVFENQNYNSIFNTSSFDGTNLEFYLWGGDAQNQLGIDFGFSGEVGEIVLPPEEVPVPATWFLVMLGMAGLVRFAKKRAV